MDSRQIKAFRSQLERLEKGIGKKRDELRAMIGDFNDLIATAEASAENLDFTVTALEDARAEFERAIDAASQLA